MITTLFLGFVALMAAVVVALSARYRLYLYPRPGLFSSLASWDCNRLLGLLSLMNVVIRAVLIAPGRST